MKFLLFPLLLLIFSCSSPPPATKPQAFDVVSHRHNNALLEANACLRIASRNSPIKQEVYQKIAKENIEKATLLNEKYDLGLQEQIAFEKEGLK